MTPESCDLITTPRPLAAPLAVPVRHAARRHSCSRSEMTLPKQGWQ